MVTLHDARQRDILTSPDRTGYVLAMLSPADMAPLLDALDELGCPPADLLVLSGPEVLAVLADETRQMSAATGDMLCYAQAARRGYAMIIIHAPELLRQRLVEEVLAAEGAQIIRAYGPELATVQRR